jgi:membrane dipeptidase
MKTDRRAFLRASLAAGAAAAFAPARPWAAPTAAALYADSIAIDGMGPPGSEENDPDGPLSDAALAHLAASGLSATHFTVGTVGTMPPLDAFERVVRSIARWERRIDHAPQVLARVRTVDDIANARRSGRVGLIYGLQDGVCFEDDLGRLDALHQFGVRVVQPTYNRRNLLGDGVMEPADAGLSRTGREAVERLQAMGMLVDLSHCGRRTAADAIAMARRPVAFTHTGCAALVEHPRHRTDAELRAVADTGGVTGIFVMPYLSRGRQPTAADVVAHIEHAIKVAGSAHVSIGTDGTLSPVRLTPDYIEGHREIARERRAAGIAAPYETEEGYLFAADLNTPRRFETLAGLLLERGHPARVVAGVLGGNLLRVFGDAWGPAKA